ncbi:MAG TPA: SMP-30/gluconolactonase/LRE family protein [Burkholderiaceae bacterium]|nr:SMP-30/gluconolactonase/LRE family protein [Burkholderiaceae bacterium]
MRMIRTLAALVAFSAATTAGAWDRGRAETFAVMPDITPGVASTIEGLAVGPDGNVYTPTFGFNSTGALQGASSLFVFDPDGHLLRAVAIQNSSPHMLGLAFNPVTGALIVCDFGAGKLLQVDPVTGASSVFMNAPNAASSGLNALTFDAAGNVYASDSFQGVIWKTGPNGTGATGTPQAWATSALLGPGTGLTPPFGANGIEFNNAGSAMYVANTALHQIIRIPLNPDGSAGTPALFTTGINAPDGIAVDRDDNLWVAANQGDEMVVVDPTGKVIAKLGDFRGISESGTVKGLLFPASPAFSKDGRHLLVTNLALYLPYAGASLAVDSGWTLQVKHYSISSLPAVIPGASSD